MAANLLERLQGMGKNLLLLIALVMVLGVNPLMEQTFLTARLLDLFFTLVLIGAGISLAGHRWRLLTVLLIGVPTLVAIWTSMLIDDPGSSLSGNLYLIRHATIAIFLLFAAGAILIDVLQAELVTIDKIYGAICVYLLLGLLWAMGYSLVDHQQPGALRFPPVEAQQVAVESADSHLADYVYYSFVTLSTVGYGDVTPTNNAARTLSWLEAVTGQLYLTILVARLVGLHIGQASSKAGP